MKYYCPSCFDNCSEEISEVKVFKGEKRNLCECVSCGEVFEEDEIYSKQQIIKELNEHIAVLEDEVSGVHEEYIRLLEQTKEEVAEIEELKRSL